MTLSPAHEGLGTLEQALVRARPALIAALRRRGLTHDRAEDLAQQACLLAWEHRGRLDARRPLLPWLLVVARRLRGPRTRHAARELPEVPAGTGTPLDAVMAGEQVRRLRGALRSLGRRQRRVVELFYQEGLSVGAIAGKLGLPPGTVKSHLHRARRLLAGVLKEHP